MSDYAQSQLDLIEIFTWPPVCPAAHRFAGPAGKVPSITLEQNPSTDTSVALNGSVLRNDPGLAKAAANVARWKTYLPEGCISAMMSNGWHWTT
jgi:hypothetical protein